ncbi:PEP-utilizing enzyme [Paenibacillus psychroresistens]|nr:PEP-utilizing enzyme [Paenibacillus psychroresistens]
MNTIRNFYASEIEEFKVVLRTVYRIIYEYQEDRTQKNENKMREAIQTTIPYLMLFKEHIPVYKQKYIELLENQYQLKPYDLIICFDRAIYELHARVKTEKFHELPWSKELRDLLNERQEISNSGFTGSKVAVAFITSGTGAYLGIVEGPACVVLDRDDLLKLKQGDILVTPMTDPDFISVAHLLSGLITDRGGLLCHAAILARELNLPCIVGCRDATQQIKDGEWIQMDSRTGIVMRLMS